MLGELNPPESPIGRCLGFQFMDHELKRKLGTSDGFPFIRIEVRNRMNPHNEDR